MKLDSSSSVSPSLALSVFLLTFLACSSEETSKPVNWSQVPVAIELRLAQSASAPGLVRAKLYGQPGTVYLHPEVLVSNSDVARAEATTARVGQGLILDVWLTRAGARRMADQTGRHIGDSLAVLVNSAVVAVPVIRQPLNLGTNQPASIGVPLGPKETQQLARAVAKTWPPAQRKTSR